MALFRDVVRFHPRTENQTGKDNEHEIETGFR